MAAESVDLNDFLDKTRLDGDFKPYMYYGQEEDSLTLYFKPDADYARRLNSRVTAFYSLEDNSLVGCSIKSIRRVLDDIKWFDVQIEDEQSKLKMLFVAHLGAATEEDRVTFQEIARHLSNWTENIPEFA